MTRPTPRRVRFNQTWRHAQRGFDRATLFWGGLIAIAGFIVLLTAPIAAVALAGFFLIGLEQQGELALMHGIKGIEAVRNATRNMFVDNLSSGAATPE